MKNIILFIFGFIGYLVPAQVGVNTQTPQATLHVDGTMQITNSLNVGGDASTPGNPGDFGDILASKSDGKAPVWIKLEDRDIAKVINIARQIGTQSANGQSWLNLNFNQQSILNASYINYDTATYVFTVTKAGYYEISTAVKVVVSGSGPYDGTSILRVYEYPGNELLFATSIGTPATIPTAYPSTTNVIYLTSGTKFRIHGIHTRNFSLSEGKVSIIYIGE